MDNKNLSKIISQALRHKPDDYGLILSNDGWVSLDDLAASIRIKIEGYPNLQVEDIIRVVSEAPKKRHQVYNGRIRALYGHSIEMDVTTKPLIPPSKLYHGTALKNWNLISSKGLVKMKRNYVHLALQAQDAIAVAEKKYKAIIVIEINSAEASNNGVLFYSNDNLTWLCKYLLPQYLSKLVK